MRTGRSQWDEGQSRRGGPVAPAGYAASKVPLITAYFWIIKLLSTAMGEATSDYMVRTINPVIAVLLGFTGFVIAMVLQFRAKAYNAWIYWLAVVMVAVFGTQAADVLHIKFGVPYVASTAFYAVVLAVIFILWYRTEGTLSIHSIRTPRREVFYWATVLATFAMGTATGDLTAKTLNLGYLASGIWFSIAFAAVAVAHWKFRPEPDPGLLDRLRADPAGRCVVRGLHSLPALGGWPGRGTRAGRPGADRRDRDPCRLPRGDAEGRRRPTAGGLGHLGPAPRRGATRVSADGTARRGPEPPLRYPGQYPDERYPGQRYPEERYSEDQYPGERHPGQPHPRPAPARFGAAIAGAAAVPPAAGALA